MPPEFDLATMFRLFAEQARDIAILFLDTEGTIRYANTGAAEIFGYPAREMVGLPARKLFTAEDVELGTPEQEQAMALADEAAEDDRWQLRSDGSRFFATGVMVKLLDEGGRHVGFAKFLRNRTDVKEQLETLRNLAASLERAARTRDIFLSTLSHELRNPLAPLANAVQLLRLSRPGSAEHDHGLKVVERQVALLERLVSDLMDLARVNTGKVDLRLASLALQSVLQGAVEATRASATARGQRIDVVMPPGEIPVEADADRLHQVFANLLANASKYTPPGGRIWVSATVEADEAVARVIDNGAGIPHEMQPRIFELFTQVESTRGQSQGGLGIGLAVVKDLVSLHGGTVQVRSDGPGKGSEFTVRLPLAAPHAGTPAGDGARRA